MTNICDKKTTDNWEANGRQVQNQLSKRRQLRHAKATLKTRERGDKREVETTIF